MSMEEGGGEEGVWAAFSMTEDKSGSKRGRKKLLHGWSWGGGMACFSSIR